MKIVQIVPGSGNTFYCQNCLRDIAMVQTLRALGHDVVMAPMYLPLFGEAADRHSGSPVFYGAVSLYLKHALPALRHLPRWVSRLLDAPPMLAWAARKAGATRADGLEALTLSMLRGEHGGQADELERLTDWLAAGVAPDVIHISNALLLGLARRLKQRLGATLVCSLQDEDTWLDAMAPDKAAEVWAAMQERARDVDGFIAVSRHYADYMGRRLALDAQRIRIVPVGIATDGYTDSPLPFDPPVIGYLSRLSQADGFGLLVEAFVRLKQEPAFAATRLIATGGQTGDDRAVLAAARRALAAHGWEKDLTVLAEFDKPARAAFLAQLTVLSAPALKGGAFGTFILEALAAGVPVVQPRLGAFTELVEDTGGGLLYTPNDAAALTVALKELLSNPPRVRRLGARGREIVRRDFSIQATAARLLDAYAAMRTHTATV